MRQTIERTWELLENTIKQIDKKTPGVVLSKGAYRRFDDNFRKLYNEIKEHYMENDVKNLDRHKVASIIIVSIIKANAIVYQGKVEQGKEFFGQYLIATSVGMTYMQYELNKLLVEKNEKTITKLWFPSPISCDTPYFEIFCRNLYFANCNNNWGLNPLDVAEKLFILEYITLEKYGINPKILKMVSSRR